MSISKRNKIAKSKKKSWRNINVDDIEESLEDIRRQEKFGGLLSEAKTEDLFFIDHGTSLPQKNKSATRHSRDRKQKEVPLLKCHQFTRGLPGAKAPIKPKPSISQNSSMKYDLNRNKQKIVRAKPKQVKRIKYDEALLEKRNFSFDLWTASENAEPVVTDEVGHSFVADLLDYQKEMMRTKMIRVPRCRFQRTSSLPHVQLPPSGLSYNPSLESHQELLAEAVEQEQKRLSQVAKEERRTTLMFPILSEAPTADSWIHEMSEGLPVTLGGDGGGPDEPDAVEGSITVTKQRTTVPKLRKTKRKEREQKLTVQKKEMAKKKRIQENAVFRIKSVEKEIREQEQRHLKARLKRAVTYQRKEGQPKRIGGVRFQEDDIEVQLGDELTDSLRCLKPSLNLVEDRFRSFQRRNLVETRLRTKLKNKKPKRVLKRDYREHMDRINNPN